MKSKEDSCGSASSPGGAGGRSFAWNVTRRPTWAATAVFVAVLIGVALLPVRSYLTKPREVIASTPSAFTGATVPIPLTEGSEACADEIVFEPDGEVARFGATAPAQAPAPALEVTARGDEEGEYRSSYRATARVDGGWRGTRQLDVRLEPPRGATFGTFCVRNLGEGPLDLVGNENGRAFSRPTLRVDGEVSAVDLPLRFLEAERSSFLERGGRIMEHAATLRPFGAWWWWLLALASAILAPLAVAAAMRSALHADAAHPVSAPVHAAWPSERLRRRVLATPGWAITAAAAVLAVLWFLYWGVNTHVFQLDEDQYVYLSRWVKDDFPSSLWNFDIYGRGLQRLEVWLLAIPAALFDSPASLIGGRFLNAVAFVSTAIPVFLLGRGMGLRSQWAALPAVLCIVVPGAVVTTAFLTENVAYPACLWVVWAIWRTTVEPSPGRDLVALVLIVVAGAARSSLLVLAPVLPAVVLLTGLRCGAGGLVARVRALARDHVVMWAAVAVAAVPFLLAPLGVDTADTLTRRLAGGYFTDLDIDAWAFAEKTGSYFSRTVIGTGFFAAAVALPWLVAQLARPADRRRFALAAVVVIAAAALLYSLAPAGQDERYILYLAPLVLLPATLALAHRQIRPAGLAIASVALAALVVRVPWNPEQGPFGFFVSPVEMFYSRAVGLRLATYLPGDGGDMLTLAGLALGAAGLALAAVLRWAPTRLAGTPATLLVVAVALSVPVQTHYTLTKYVNGAGSRAAESLSQRAFVDRTVPGDASVGQLAEGVGQLPEFFPIWREVQFYNQQIDAVFSIGPNLNPVPPGDALVADVVYDERTGRIRSPEPLPDHLAIPTHVGAVRVRGEVLQAPSYVAVALIRVAQPATLAWRISGTAPYGLLEAGRPGVIRFYGAGLSPGAHCAALNLTAAADRAASWRIARGTRTLARGRLAPGATRTVAVPLPRLVERGFLDVAVRGTALQVSAISVDGGC